MGLVIGTWLFQTPADLPSSRRVASGLASATGLSFNCTDSEHEADERIVVDRLGEALFDIERQDSILTLCSGMPAHPYLWENLDRVLTQLGGHVAIEANRWRPDPRHYHLRRAWHELTTRQRILLRLPTIGVWRVLDRFA